MERWSGKVAAVTGASSGIGAAISVVLAENGLIVVGLARREEKIQELASSTKGVIHPMKCDLMCEDDIIRCFREIEDRFGGVDVLVNNAGSFTISGLTDSAYDEWNQVLNTNVQGLSICSSEAIKTMRKRGDDGTMGHRKWIKNMASMYTTSKYAITCLTEILRSELRMKGSKIKVTSLSPGLVLTDMLTKGRNELDNKVSQPGKVRSPTLYTDDIADAVIYILSAKSYVEVQELNT